ncbi:MAG: protein kinase domain-containing protein [Elusimicrobiota bacterium]
MYKGKIIKNKYIIDRLIGTGGLASVYKAWDIMLHKYVAVKKIHKKYAKDAKFVDMFREEAINTARLEHENVVRVLNFLKEEDDYYMIMEYVKGVDLEYLLKKCSQMKIAVPHEIAVHIIAEITKGLSFAHAKKDELSGRPLNIVHRDITPGNIMLYFSGRIKLADFGIAKAGSARHDEDKINGKISYLSPEQAQGKALDARSDIFGCGLVFYELLSGEKAYEGASETEVWKKAKNAKIDLKKIKKAEVDPHLINILRKMLRKNPQERYQSASDMFVDIKKYLSRVGRKDEMVERYIYFLNEVLGEEKKYEEKNGFYDPEKEIEIIKNSTESEKKEIKKKETLPAGSSSAPASPDKTKDKTVIEFVFNTAKKHKKIIKTSLLSIIAAFIMFSSVDFFARMTPVGVKIYNYFNPPELSIDTEPSGAALKIVNEKGVDIVEKGSYKSRTPLHLEKISPGTYLLEASKENFAEITRVLEVFERETGGRKFQISGARQKGDIYVIPFEVEVNIESIPSGSEVYINGISAGRTPFSGELEIGEHNLQLVHQGYETLGSSDPASGMQTGLCLIDTSGEPEGQDMIDYDFWDISREQSDEGAKAFKLEGSLWKYVSLVSRPQGASAYLRYLRTGETFNLGATPTRDLKLVSGDYHVSFEKAGYEKLESEFTLNDRTENTLEFIMNKYVTLSAYDHETGDPLNASVAVFNRNINTIRGETPMRVSLPLEKVSFSFSKEPAYEPLSIERNIEDLGDTLRVAMQVRDPHLSLSVEDYFTARFIESAEVFINEELWRETGRGGQAMGYVDIPPGKYPIRVAHEDYDDYKSVVDLNKGQRQRLEVRLGAPSDGIALLDIPEGITIDSALVDGREVKINRDDTIRNIMRGRRHIDIKIRDSQKKVSGYFELTRPEEFVIIEISEKDGEFNLEAKGPPGLRVRVSDKTGGEPVDGALLSLDDKLLGETNEEGIYASYLLQTSGEYTLKVSDPALKPAEKLISLSSGRTTEVNLEVDAQDP